MQYLIIHGSVLIVVYYVVPTPKIGGEALGVKVPKILTSPILNNTRSIYCKYLYIVIVNS